MYWRWTVRRSDWWSQQHSILGNRNMGGWKSYVGFFYRWSLWEHWIWTVRFHQTWDPLVLHQWNKAQIVTQREIKLFVLHLKLINWLENLNDRTKRFTICSSRLWVCHDQCPMNFKVMWLWAVWQLAQCRQWPHAQSSPD